MDGICVVDGMQALVQVLFPLVLGMNDLLKARK